MVQRTASCNKSCPYYSRYYPPTSSQAARCLLYDLIPSDLKVQDFVDLGENKLCLMDLTSTKIAGLRDEDHYELARVLNKSPTGVLRGRVNPEDINTSLEALTTIQSPPKLVE